jgi:outer membrane protein OmpA-like peptidoglycan-associated protein
LICGAVALPAASYAQQDEARSEEDYVCAFTGECPETSGDETQERPRLDATRGFSLSTPETERPQAERPRRPAPRTRSQRRPTQAAGPRRPAAAQGQRVNLRLTFELGSDKMTARAEAEARVFARSLMLPQLLNMRFRIEGHTDSIGGRAMNLALSQRRAQSVASFLVGMGVARERLEVMGYGPDRPLPGLRTTDGENRRVEAVRVS